MSAAPEHPQAVPTSVILKSGNEIKDVKGYADQIADAVDRAKEENVKWLWLERARAEQPEYRERQYEPVALLVDEIAAVAGITQCSK